VIFKTGEKKDGWKENEEEGKEEVVQSKGGSQYPTKEAIPRGVDPNLKLEACIQPKRSIQGA
jgi:hypothetical protein